MKAGYLLTSFLIRFTTKTIKISISDANKRYITDPPKSRLQISINAVATILPIAIARKAGQVGKSAIPAIKLPDHTPVKGSGIATNRAK